MLEGSDSTSVSIPWPVLAGAFGALAAVVSYLFKIVIDRHNAEIKARDERRAEDSQAWKAALDAVVASSEKTATMQAASNERAASVQAASYRDSMASLGGQIGEAVSRQIKDSGKQQEDLIRQILQPGSAPKRTVRKSR